MATTGVREHRQAPTAKREAGPARRRSFPECGFSLIELVIALAIVAILLAIALPNYREHVRKSARAEAQSYLTSLASRQQQHLVDKRRYATTSATLGLALPASLAGKFQDPVTIEVPEAVPPTFRLVARAHGDQAKDKCPTLTLDNAGNREPAGCW
jgi:type IV pilus assembly protein PilE